MADARSMTLVTGDLLTVRISHAANEMIARSADCRAHVNAIEISRAGTAVEICLSVVRAEQLREWALDVWKSAERGQRKTLTSLATSLTDALRGYRTRDCVPDPGKKAIVEARSQGARLAFGTVVVDEDNDLVQIISGPDFYKVTNENGRHAGENGSRFDWQYGYCAAPCEEGGVLSGSSLFYPLHRLWSKDNGDITYLKLVHSAG